MKKIIASAASALLVAVGLTFAVTPAASATEECVPREAVPAWTEVVPDIEHPAVYETVVVTPATEGTAAVWANFSPNDQHATFIGPPTYPVDERGTWHDHGTLPPGQAGPDGVYANGNPDKGGNWFYRQAAVEGTEAVTEERLVSEAYTEVIPDIEHPPVDAVTCESEEPEPVDPIDCTPTGFWYTEADDVAPVQVKEGLAFISAGDGKAVGYRQAVGGNLQGWDSLSFSANGDLSQFFFRITVNLSADGGPSYKSLSFPGYTTIDADSLVYQFPGQTLADVAEAYPNNVVTSIGWQTNSGAPEGVGAVLYGFDGGCGSADFSEPVVVPEKPEDIVTVDEEEVVDCEADTVTTTTTTTTVTHLYDEQTNTWVAAEPTTQVASSEREATDVECPPVVVTPPVEEPVEEEPVAKPQARSTQELASTGGTTPEPLLYGGGLLLALGAGALLARWRLAKRD